VNNTGVNSTGLRSGHPILIYEATAGISFPETRAITTLPGEAQTGHIPAFDVFFQVLEKPIPSVKGEPTLGSCVAIENR
jgi:hypothetical protein